MNPQEVEQLRDRFPVTRNWIYMNHAAVSPLSSDMASAMTRRVEELAADGAVHYRRWMDDVEHCRRMYARLLAARPQEVTFLDSTAEGVNRVANGLRWKDGDNVVTVDVEYPANVYPWWNLKEVGVQTRMVHNRQGRVEPKDLYDAMDSRTRVLALSFVEFSNGFRSDLAAIGAECRRRGVLFFVDAIQDLGALRMDVNEMHIDFLAAHSRKWLLCPGGKGAFFVRDDVLDRLRVTSVGAGSVVNATDYLDYDLTFVTGARRFEGGGDSPVAFAATRAMLALFTEVGTERVEEQVLALTDYLCERLSGAGFKLDTYRGPGEKSGIATFYRPTRPSIELSQRLEHGKVVHTHRYQRIRLSPHFYNTEDEIDEVLKILG